MSRRRLCQQLFFLCGLFISCGAAYGVAVLCDTVSIKVRTNKTNRVCYKNVIFDINGVLITNDTREVMYDTLEIVKKLKASGFRLFILSNTRGKGYERIKKIPYFLELFDGVVLSCQVNLKKPSAAIFHYLFEQYHINPEESVFIDDRKNNVAAGKRLKMKSIFFTNARILEEKLQSLHMFPVTNE